MSIIFSNEIHWSKKDGLSTRHKKKSQRQFLKSRKW